MTESLSGVGPSIHLFHPFTARAIGWPDEIALPEFHSRPHAHALRELTATMGARCTVSYLSDRSRPYKLEVDGLRYQYWPRSLQNSERYTAFRRERSVAALTHEMVSPADVTIINTSGHGGPFSQTHGLILRARRRPYVAMIGGDNVTLRGRQLQFLRRAVLVVVHNGALRNRMVADGVPSESLMVVPLGVDTDAYSPAPGGTAALGRTIVYVGRINAWKGVHRIIEALGVLAPAFPDVKLRLVGPEPDAAYSTYLRDLATRLLVSSRLEFVGALPGSELPSEYRRAAVTVLPSESEGYGMVVAESMACGTPVVALEGSGGPEGTITSGIDGLLVPVGQLASGIAGLLRDQEHLALLGEAARRSAVERLSSRVTDQCFEELVARAIRPTPSGCRDNAWRSPAPGD